MVGPDPSMPIATWLAVRVFWQSNWADNQLTCLQYLAFHVLLNARIPCSVRRFIFSWIGGVSILAWEKNEAIARKLSSHATFKHKRSS